MIVELRSLGLHVEQQKGISVFYRETLVGEYFADLIVENAVIVELKSVEKVVRAHEAQLINYLRATLFEVGLLLNFGQSPEYKRKIYDIRKPISCLYFLIRENPPNPLYPRSMLCRPAAAIRLGVNLGSLWSNTSSSSFSMEPWPAGIFLMSGSKLRKS